MDINASIIRILKVSNVTTPKEYRGPWGPFY